MASSKALGTLLLRFGYTQFESSNKSLEHRDAPFSSPSDIRRAKKSRICTSHSYNRDPKFSSKIDPLSSQNCG